MAGEPVTLAEVVEAGVSNALSELHTSLPGEVKSYDPVTNTAVVRPAIKQAIYGVVSGKRSYLELPELLAVPVIWPRAGGMVCRLPIAPGDSVWLMFSEGGLAEWKRNGGVCEPQDARRHSIGWPVAIPGAFPTATTLSPIDAAAIASGSAIFGEDGGRQVRVGALGVELAPAGVTPISPIALAVPLMTYLASLQAAVVAMQAALTVIGPATLTPAACAPAITASGTAVADAAIAAGVAGGAVPSTLVRAV